MRTVGADSSSLGVGLVDIAISGHRPVSASLGVERDYARPVWIIDVAQVVDPRTMDKVAVQTSSENTRTQKNDVHGALYIANERCRPQSTLASPTDTRTKWSLEMQARGE